MKLRTKLDEIKNKLQNMNLSDKKQVRATMLEVEKIYSQISRILISRKIHLSNFKEYSLFVRNWCICKEIFGDIIRSNEKIAKIKYNTLLDYFPYIFDPISVFIDE